MTLEKEILGGSHLVFGAKEISKGCTLFSNFSYLLYGEMSRGRDPKAKEIFLHNKDIPNYEMQLMHTDLPLLPIEVLNEHTEYYQVPKGEMPIYEGIIGDLHDVDIKKEAQLAVAVKNIAIVQSKRIPVGCFELDPKPGVKGIIGLLIRCCDMKKSIEFWEKLGFNPLWQGNDFAYIKLKSLLSRRFIYIFFLATAKSSVEMFLNQEGIVCLSFFCKNADRLNRLFRDQGIVVGDCYDFRPFNQLLRIFFMKGPSGELYEFLSVIDKK